jgi:hypothetical protein
MPFSYEVFGGTVKKKCLVFENRSIEKWLNCCEVRNVDDDDDDDEFL